MVCTREPIYRVGDTVRIVDKPYSDCPFSWVGAMSHYCGYNATIEEVLLELEWGETNEEGYRIDTDNGEFVWCANCFEPAGADIEESDANLEILFGGVAL